MRDTDKVRSAEDLERVLKSISMTGTRFQEWNFDWKIEEVRESVVCIDTETTSFSPFENPEGLVMAKTPQSEVTGWFILSSFERPNVNDPEESGIGYGRRWYVERDSSVERVVFTCWLAIRQIVEHELHEAFTVDLGDRRVRLLDPHKSLEDVAYGSRTVCGVTRDEEPYKS